MIGQDPLFGFVALIIAVFISRLIMEKASKQLSSDEKARLVDAFSGYRIYNYAALSILLVLYFSSIRFSPQSESISTPLFFISILAMIAIASILNYRKLKGMNMPSNYIKSYLTSMGIRYVGIGFAFAPVVAKYAW